MAQRVFDLIFGINVDQNKARQAGQAIDQMTAKVEELEQSVSSLNQAEGALNDINSRIAATGAVIFAPLVLSATRYVDAVGKAEAGSRRWLAANERISQSTVKIGREATNALVPYLEALASIAEMASNIDPAIVRAGVNIGGGLILVGAVGLLSANVVKFVSATRDLTASMIKLSAGGGVGGGLANLGVGLTAIGVGSALGVGSVNVLGAATGNERLQNYSAADLGKTVGQLFILLLKQVTDGLTGFVGVIFDLAEAISLGVFKLDDALADLIDSVKIAAVNLVLGIADLEVLGKRLGDVLGIDDANLRASRNNIEFNRANRQTMANATEVIDAQGNRTLTERGRIQQQFNEWNDNLDNIQDSMTEAVIRIGEFFGVIETESDKALSALEEFDTELLDKFEQFQEGLVDAQEEFDERRADELEDFNEETIKIEDAYNRQREQQVEDFERNRATIESDFQDKRRDAVKAFEDQQKEDLADFTENQLKAQREANTENLKAIEDFNRARERAEQDHQDRLRGAAARLDATAVLEELRSFNKDQRRAQEDFSLEQNEREQQTRERVQAERQEFEALQRERVQQFQARQQQEQENFDLQQARAVENFQRQQDRQQEAFERQQDERERDFRDRRQEERQNFMELQQSRRDEFRQQLEDLQAFQNAESTARIRHYQALQRQLDAFIGGGRLPSRSGQRTMIPAFAEGGLSSGGLAMLHEGEGVLNRRSTEALMRAVGSFNQQRIQNFVNNKNADLAVQNTFNQPMMSEGQIERAVERSMIRLLESV